MIVNILKMIFIVLGLSMFFYSISAFGYSPALLVFPCVSVFILLSMFFDQLKSVSIMLCRVSGVVSLLAFLFLLLAGTIGGSFNLSPSNQVIATMLFGLSLVGLSSFFLSTSEKEST